jgi:hypothetical protein
MPGNTALIVGALRTPWFLPIASAILAKRLLYGVWSQLEKSCSRDLTVKLGGSSKTALASD